MLFSGLQTFKNTPGAVLSICTCKHLGNAAHAFQAKRKHLPKHSCNFDFHNPKVYKYSPLLQKSNLARIFSFPNESSTQLQAQAVILANTAKKTTQETDQFHRKKCLCYFFSSFSFNASVEMLSRFSFFTKFLNPEAQISEMTWPYNSVRSTINHGLSKDLKYTRGTASPPNRELSSY